MDGFEMIPPEIYLFLMIIVAGIGSYIFYRYYCSRIFTKEGWELKHVRPSTRLEKKIGLIALIVGCGLLTVSFFVSIFNFSRLDSWIFFEDGGNWIALGVIGAFMALIGVAGYFEMVGIPGDIFPGMMMPRKMSNKDLRNILIVLIIFIIIIRLIIFILK